MVIDIDERCANLGIDPDVFSSAEEKVLEATSNIWWEGGAFAHLEEFPQVLNDEEIIAYARWHKLHIRYPQYFTWDGWRH